MRVLFVESWRAVLARPLALLTGVAGLGSVLALAWWWLSLPVAGAIDLGLLALVGLAVLALSAWLVWRAFRIWRRTEAPASRALARAAFYAALLKASIVGLLLPWLLVRWVLEFDSLVAQAASMAARFLLAALLFTASLLWLGAVAAALVEGETDVGEDLHLEERPADPAG